MEFKSNYSCNTASETLEWINAIVKFLKPYKFFFQANVVNFLKDRLWEAVDEDWIDCLKHEHVEHLLQIPSGIVQDHWPASLKEYVLTAKLLAFPRERAKLEKELPGISMTSLNCVLSQGMNPKKKHEVEVLSSLVSCITRNMGAHTVIDVGAGQGYLSLVLAFQHQLPVVAIDASSHHGAITNIRAERIKKHYAAKLHNSGKGLQNMPITMTCRVLSSSMLRNLSNYCCQQDGFDKNHKIKGSNQISPARFEAADLELPSSGNDSDCESSLVLAGLHACGDLSVTMLRAFAECKEVKAVVSIGCCYNLLTESRCENSDLNCGFPVSKGLRLMNFTLGKNARDLACQSAERWRSLEKDAGIQNFDLHGFRAVFQMVLDRYYPEVLFTSPSIGRQGKALCRQQKKSFTNPSDSAESKFCYCVCSFNYSINFRKDITSCMGLGWSLIQPR
ncbi:methyltransferase-like protein 25 isoform X2 [Chenopodium quinoa]|uniref:methyltransferase-like protein 25 isoform X2 n=1 Tax=Chenopodium quinoa TaxID=63459 RepID=UPI000B793078|nr:methyltransferase-like protein 25 isoform X2 [Chenopodium quinoa]